MTSSSSILITGATGLVGRKLVEHLGQSLPGVALHVLTRAPEQASRFGTGVKEFGWSPENGHLDEAALEDVGCVVHLAGAPVAQRWTPNARAAIRSSRIGTMELLRDQCRAMGLSPRVVTASAIGWYAEGAEWRNESDPCGPGFLCEVVRDWEAAAHGLGDLGGGSVALRIGLVLSPNGGVLQRLLPLYRMGLGAPLAPGDQWQSWIHLDDLVRTFAIAIGDTSWSGAFNAVSPHPVQQQEFSASLARALARPHFLPPVPRWAIRLQFGDAASALLASHRVACGRLREMGFQHHYPELPGALDALLK